MPSARLGLLLIGLLTSCATLGKKDPNAGVVVTIQVLDTKGSPIPTAVVRHPEEADPHRVNSLNGEWYASELYLPDGGEIIFQPGMDLKLEISAPGYMTRNIQYKIEKRKNDVPVTLDTLEVDDSEIIAPTLEFGRDKPREGMPSGASN